MTQILIEEASQARTWRTTWTLINGTLSAVSIGGLFVLPREQRPDLILGSVLSLISTAFSWFVPLDVEAAAAEAELIHLPPKERAAALQRLIVRSAEDEAERLRWYWHVGNFVSALIPAAIEMFVFHHRQQGVLSIMPSFASGEVELLTQPSGLLGWRESPRVALAIGASEHGAWITYRASF